MLTRRGLLRAVGGLGVGSVAGCVGGDGGGGVTASTTTQPESPFAGVSFAGPDLVVRLVGDNGLTGVNLIAPDGSLFAQAAVEPGVTTVRLPILEITPVNWVHYTPGVHELVAVAGEEAVGSMALEMRPALEIVDVRQYRAGEGADFGYVTVNLTNNGTAPTWVYDIAFTDAPNWAANGELGSDAGSPILFKPEVESELFIQPGENRAFVGPLPPLLFEGIDQSCDPESHKFQIIVGSAMSPSLNTEVMTTKGGYVEPAGLTDEYTCTDVQVEVIDPG